MTDLVRELKLLNLHENTIDAVLREALRLPLDSGAAAQFAPQQWSSFTQFPLRSVIAPE